ncbi:hypothetical protein KAJ27_22810 [bacterium]|nr:hypothetical protein [bacterium]
MTVFKIISLLVLFSISCGYAFTIDSFSYLDGPPKCGWVWYNSGNRLPGDFVTSLEKNDEGTIYIGTWHGLVIKKKNQWYVMDCTDGLSDNKVTSLKYVKKKKSLYIGTISLRDHGGLNVLSGNTIEVINVSNGLPSNDIISLEYDEKNDILFAGTWGKGLGMLKDGKWEIKNMQNGLLSNNIMSLAVDKFSRTWMGTKFDVGFSIYENNEWKDYNEHNSGLINNAVLDIEFSENEVWFGTWGGLDQIVFGEKLDDFKKWIHFQTWSLENLKGRYNSKAYKLPSNFVRKIYYDRKTKSIWFGTNEGLAFYNFKDTWIVFTTTSKIVSKFDNKKSEWRIDVYPYVGLKSNQIFDILVVDDTIIVATDKGAGFLDFYNQEKLESGNNENPKK